MCADNVCTHGFAEATGKLQAFCFITLHIILLIQGLSVNLELGCGLVSSKDPHASAADSPGVIGMLSYHWDISLAPRKGFSKLKNTDKIMNLLTKTNLVLRQKGLRGREREQVGVHYRHGSLDLPKILVSSIPLLSGTRTSKKSSWFLMNSLPMNKQVNVSCCCSHNFS